MAIAGLCQILLLILVSNSTFALANNSKDPLIIGRNNQSEFSQQTFEILQHAYRKMGISVIIKTYPSKRSLAMSNSGKIDGELARIEGIDSQYPNLVAVPVILHQSPVAAFTIDGRTKFDNIKDILSFPIAMQRGILWQENFIANKPEYVIRTQETKQKLKLLTIGRVKYIIGSVRDVEHLKKKFPNYVNIKQVSPLINNINYVHYIHKKHRHLIPQLTIEIKKRLAELKVKPLNPTFPAH